MKKLSTLILVLITITLSAQPPTLNEAEKSLANEIEFDQEVLLMLRNQTKAAFIKIPVDETHEIPAIAVRLGHFDAPAVLKELKNRLVFKGYVIFLSDNGNESIDGLHELRLLKAEDPLIPIKYMNTTSTSPEHTNLEIYEKIEKWHGYNGCTVEGAGKNWLTLKFVIPLEDTDELAQDIIDFCPKILNFNGSKENLALDLKDKPSLNLEWY
ncbi:DUF4253 domain-containing protein [uncultured Croceitalea sp.]|uniref:DUF4253 domain-containing protein n=1 Tax=uncultured Croceitalea sp. TaxID=1798908 RepID=UPI00374EF7F2